MLDRESFIRWWGKEVQVEKLLKKFERSIVIALLAMMSLVVFLSTAELAVIIVETDVGWDAEMGSSEHFRDARYIRILHDDLDWSRADRNH